MNDNNLPNIINTNMTLAYSILENYENLIDIPKDIYPEDRAKAIRIASLLDHFNNGYYPGWPHCDDDRPKFENLMFGKITKILESIDRLLS